MDFNDDVEARVALVVADVDRFRKDGLTDFNSLNRAMHENTLGLQDEVIDEIRGRVSEVLLQTPNQQIEVTASLSTGKGRLSMVVASKKSGRMLVGNPQKRRDWLSEREEQNEKNREGIPNPGGAA